jgi:multicomponent Na+:H+ antiporter subunit D
MVVTMLSPLLPALLAPLASRYRRAYHLFSLLVAGINVAMLLATPIADQQLFLGHALSFFFDNNAWLFALLTNMAWFIIIIYSYSYTPWHFQELLPHFYALMCLSMTIVTANGYAANMITLLVFYLAGILAALPLIRIRRSIESYRASMLYLVQMLLPALFILLPTVLYYQWQYGDTSFAHGINQALQHSPQTAAVIVWGLVLGMSANLIYPFSTWLPQTQITPAPATALLHTVAIVNTGAIVLLKFGQHVLGTSLLHDLSHEFWHTGWLIYALGLNAVVAAWQALRTPNLKQRFSFSTISQVSYILTAILIGTPATLLGAVLHMLSHSIAKIGLFFVAGYYNARYGTVHAGQLRPLMPHTRILAAFIALCGLSIIGFPLLAGYYSKDLMLLAEIKDSHWAAGGFLLLGSLINVLYILPLVRSAMRKKNPAYTFKRVPVGMALAMGICVALILSFSVYAVWLIHKFQPGLERELEQLSLLPGLSATS